MRELYDLVGRPIRAKYRQQPHEVRRCRRCCRDLWRRVTHAVPMMGSIDRATSSDGRALRGWAERAFSNLDAANYPPEGGRALRSSYGAER